MFVHLPSGGIRLTDLARAAGILKQAMAELVNEVVEKIISAASPTRSTAAPS